MHLLNIWQKKVKAPAPAKAAVIRGVSNFAKFRKKLLDSQNVEQAAELEQTTTVVTTTVTTVVTTPNKSSENLKLFDGGFFTVESPVKNCTLGGWQFSWIMVFKLFDCNQSFYLQKV